MAVFIVLRRLLILLCSGIYRLKSWPQAVIILARPYIHLMVFSLLPNFLFTVGSQLFFGLGKPRVIMIMAFVFLPITIALNYLLMYGKLGLPALGIIGLGLGTVISTFAEMLVLFFKTQRTFKDYLSQGAWFNKLALRELLSHGVPTGLTWLVEVGFFSTTAFLMGLIGINALAAHELSFQIDNFAFMIAVNMGQALQLIVGEAAGEKNYAKVMPTYWIAQIFLVSLWALVAIFVWCWPKILLYLALGAQTNINTEVMQIALSLLKILPIFLFLDSIGFLTFSALRGLKATRFSLAVVFAVYWLMILPILIIGVAYYHAFSPQMLWGFLCLGAALSFVFQFWRFRFVCWKLNTSSL